MKICTLIMVLLCFTAFRGNAQWTYDSVSFEAPTDKIVLEPTEDNLWQIGIPQKPFFSAAHGGIRAILTDTVDSYPPGDTASFIYIIRNPYTQTCITSMEFWHKHDMDPMGDMGLIDVSYDGGNSWDPAKDTSLMDPMGTFFWWEADYHESTGEYSEHPLVTTGTSDGWIKSVFSWQWWIPVRADSIIINPDSLMIRFTFISDSSIDQREGWMIDEIVTASGGWQICSGVEDHLTNTQFSVYPNPFNSGAILHADPPLESGTVCIYDVFGRVLRYIDGISGTNISISREDLPGGLYFLTVTDQRNLSKVIKILIKD